MSSKFKHQDKLTPFAEISAIEIPKLGLMCMSAPAPMLLVTSSRFKDGTALHSTALPFGTLGNQVMEKQSGQIQP